MSAVLGTKKQLIPIRAWAESIFPKPHTPCKNTLLRWTHTGRINPQPEKVGKNWYVSPSAEYQGD
jgi:hypothetical protein